jgi:hypothetical protein
MRFFSAAGVNAGFLCRPGCRVSFTSLWFIASGDICHTRIDRAASAARPALAFEHAGRHSAGLQAGRVSAHRLAPISSARRGYFTELSPDFG